MKRLELLPDMAILVEDDDDAKGGVSLGLGSEAVGEFVPRKSSFERIGRKQHAIEIDLGAPWLDVDSQ